MLKTPKDIKEIISYKKCTLLSKLYSKFKNTLDFKKLLGITKNLSFPQAYTIFSKYYNYNCYRQFFDDLVKFRMINYIIINLEYIKLVVGLDTIISSLKSIKGELSEKEIDEITDEIIKIILELPYELRDKKENIDFMGIRIIFNEILKNERKDIFDIKYIGSGCYSSVYNVGDKIIKFGKRLTYQIPDDKRLLSSIIRREFNIEGPSFNETVFIEIMEAVDTLSDNVYLSFIDKEEIVYNIYRELRENGKIWADPKVNNVGILRKDNKVYFDGISSVNKESLGYIKETIKDDEILKTGDYVILDTDLIYLDADFDYEKMSETINISNYDDMEKRYQEEKKLKN